jgi:hypothetical protein
MWSGEGKMPSKDLRKALSMPPFAVTKLPFPGTVRLKPYQGRCDQTLYVMDDEPSRALTPMSIPRGSDLTRGLRRE